MKSILQEFQIECLRKFGNTIVAKKHGKQKIIDECIAYGFEVKVREFIANVDPTHYVIELIK